ncbi:MAG: STAS domain-containing protein [Pseudomonadota bacterium]
MGLLSLFKRNSTPQPERDDGATRRRRAEDTARLDPNTEIERQNEQLRQREIARATAMKIDAIEAAMASDIFNGPEPAWSNGQKRAQRAKSHGDEVTLTMTEVPTTELLSDGELPQAAVAAESAPIVEEIAIMYANEQAEVAEHMLVDSLAAAGEDRTVWWMLFDLYQVSGQQEKFDNLSIDYASKFETSPPAWASGPATADAGKPYSGVTPTQAFSGVLGEHIGPQLARVQQLAAANNALRLEFNRVTGVEPAGCALLLHSLKALQQQRKELIVVAAAELADHIRDVIEVGRREDEPCWLLLLELLQLLNREKDFEETGMDYCVTFEVSPPSFVAPSKVATAAKQYASVSTDRFMLPAVIKGDSGPLLDAIANYASQYDPVVLDCSRLARLDFGAAAQLLSRLQVLAQDGKKIEFRDVNHLVAALLRLLAFSDIAKIFPHNY